MLLKSHSNLGVIRLLIQARRRLHLKYLCGSQYKADGGAGFFEKIAAQGGGSQPEFLSTHPSPSNRIENYHTWASESNCVHTEGNSSMSYNEFKKLF